MTSFKRPLPAAAAALALLLGVALAGCAKKGAEGERTMSPDDASGGGAEADLDALEAQLAAREEQLRALQAGPPAAEDTVSRDVAGAGRTAKGGDAEPARSGESAPVAATAPAEPVGRSNGPVPENRCTNVCELQAAICQLQDQICGLVPRHEGEPRYQRACERATTDCNVATEACHACA